MVQRRPQSMMPFRSQSRAGEAGRMSQLENSSYAMMQRPHFNPQRVTLRLVLPPAVLHIPKAHLRLTPLQRCSRCGFVPVFCVARPLEKHDIICACVVSVCCWCVCLYLSMYGRVRVCVTTSASYFKIK